MAPYTRAITTTFADAFFEALVAREGVRLGAAVDKDPVIGLLVRMISERLDRNPPAPKRCSFCQAEVDASTHAAVLDHVMKCPRHPMRVTEVELVATRGNLEIALHELAVLQRATRVDVGDAPVANHLAAFAVCHDCGHAREDAIHDPGPGGHDFMKDPIAAGDRRLLEAVRDSAPSEIQAAILAEAGPIEVASEGVPIELLIPKVEWKPPPVCGDCGAVDHATGSPLCDRGMPF